MVQSFHYFSSNHRALLRQTDYSRNKHAMLTLDAMRRGRKMEEEDNRRRRGRKEKKFNIDQVLTLKYKTLQLQVLCAITHKPSKNSL